MSLDRKRLTNIRSLQNLQGIGGNASHDALTVRDQFKNYFNSSTGSVSWQQERVRAGRFNT